MNKQKLQIWLPLLISLSMVTGILIGFNLKKNLPDNGFFSLDEKSTLNEVLSLIDNKYVDKINMEQLKDTAIEAILNKLDPHSVYIPASELEDVNDDIQGNFYGIGIEFEIYHDTLNVTNVMENGPAQQSGFQIGDKIIKVNNTIVAGKKMEADSIKSLLRGNRGTRITVELLRNKQPVKKDISRDLIPVSSIDASYMIDSKTGFIKINKFSTQTYREFMESLTNLKKQGLQNLILDLRDNGGGVLDEAIEIADEFLDGDKLITYTEGKHSPKKEYRCRRLGQFEKGKLSILADEGSASASEVLMGALQDWDRATIIGRRSFGKGLVQEQFNLSDNGALRLTIARYYTPTGRSIQRSYENGSKAYYAEVEDRIQNNDSAGTANNRNGKIYTTPSGKKLFGGGGIMPDFIINADTTTISEEYTKLLSKGTVNHFAIETAVENKTRISQFKSPVQFMNDFNLDENMQNKFKSYLISDNININNLTPEERKLIQQNIKLLISRTIWNNKGFFEAQGTEDNNILKALETMN